MSSIFTSLILSGNVSNVASFICLSLLNIEVLKIPDDTPSFLYDILAISIGVSVSSVMVKLISPDVSSFFGKTLRGRNIHNATEFSLYLLEEATVATVTGEAFGDANCIRFSYAASEKDLREAIRRIKESLQ